VRLTNEQQELVTEFLEKYPNPVAPIRAKYPGLVTAYLANNVGDNDDLNQTAIMAVSRAAFTYDATHRIAFATYAINGVRLGIISALQNFNTDARKVPTKMLSGDAPYYGEHKSFWESHPAPEPTEPRYGEDELQLLRSAIENLPATYKRVVRKFYGFNGEPMNLKEIGREMALAGPTIRDKKERALKMLNGRLARVLSHTTEDIPCNA
jgi:RNA polymerase sigma factor (sigma-70 family)